MPVADSEKSNTLLEDTLKAYVEDKGTFEDIEHCLHNLKERCETKSQCSPALMEALSTTVKQELKEHHHHNVSTILACIQHLATDCSENKGIVVLLENGLLELIVFVYEDVIKHIHGDTTCQSTAHHCLIQLLETVNDIADFGSSTKANVALLLVEKLMVFIVNVKQNFAAKMESLRTLNLLLEGCPAKYLRALQNDGTIVKILNLMAESLPKTGDFEMQVACAEALIRVIKKSDRADFGRKCFTDDAVFESFLKIQDACFEVDCRMFLNTLNEKLGNERLVFSIPCDKVYLGTYLAKRPQGDKLTEFWVDFNQLSRTITIYVAEEEDANEESCMWETITISDDAVNKCDVKRVGDFQHVEISLSVPASKILPCSKSDAKRILIVFTIDHDLQCPLTSCFQPDKIHSQVRKKSSECTIKVLFKRMGDGRGIATESFYGGKSTAPKGKSKTETSKSLTIPVKRTKISAPLNSMNSPLGSRSSGTQGKKPSSSTTKKKNPDVNQPKTPQHPAPTKRVKTPLNVTVSDKASSGSDTDKGQTKKGSPDPKLCLPPVAVNKKDYPAPKRLDDKSGGKDAAEGGTKDDGTPQRKSDGDVRGDAVVHCGDEIMGEDRGEQTCVTQANEELHGNEKTSSSVATATNHTEATSCEGLRKSSIPRDGLTASGNDTTGRKPDKVQKLSTTQVIPESQGSQVVINETQEDTADICENKSINQNRFDSQASESEKSQPKKNKLTRPRPTGGRKRRSPRLEALENLNALSPRRKRRSQRGKFQLYSEESRLLEDPDEGMIVPSTYPSQDSMEDFVPDDYCAAPKYDERRKSASPDLSDILEKVTESTSSEPEEKRKAKQRPRRSRKRKGKVGKPRTRTSKSLTSKHRKTKEDDTGSESSTLHQTREFLSQSLPALSPSIESGDPYLFSDLRESSDKKVKSAERVKKQKKKRITKPNLNVPDRNAFLRKKSFMSFPSKFLTSTKAAKSVYGRGADGEGDSLGVTAGRSCKVKENMRNNKNSEENSNQNVNNKGELGGEVERQNTEEEEVEKQMSGESDVNVSRGSPIGVSDEVLPADGQGEDPGGVREEEAARMQAGGDGRDTRKTEKSLSKISPRDDKDVDVSFASREMLLLPEIEVMRDVPHFEDDFQDDELHRVVSSLNQFMVGASKEMAGKLVSLEKAGRGETMLYTRDKGGNHVLMESGLQETQDEDGEPTEGAVEEQLFGRMLSSMETRYREGERETTSEKSSSVHGGTIEELEEELQALGKELQVSRKRRMSGLREQDKTVSESEKLKGKALSKEDCDRYGSEIEDGEEEDEGSSDLNLEFEDDTRRETSVQSFSRLCQNILHQSGDAGIAKNRSKRRLPKVDYTDQDTSYSDDDHDVHPSFEETSLEPLDIQLDDDDEDCLSFQSQRRSSCMSDRQSEKSWLVEKSKVRVSTYSKVERRRWTKERHNEGVFKSTKKISHKKDKRKRPADELTTELLAPKKRRKKDSIGEDDREYQNLYYFQGSGDQVLGKPELLIQKISATGLQHDIDFTPDLSCASKSSKRSRSVKPKESKVVIVSPLSHTADLTSAENDTNEEDNLLEYDMDDAESALFSGPGKMSHLTQSTLRHKYKHLIEDIRQDEAEDEEDDSHPEESLDDANLGPNPPLIRRSMNPRRLFEEEIKQRRHAVLGKQTTTDDFLEDEDEYDEDASFIPSSSSTTSSWLHSTGSLPIPDMMAIVGEKLQKQMSEKKTQAKLMTDAALKTTQNYLSKLWVGQNRRRSTALHEFRESLFKEIVGLDMDMEKRVKASEKLQATARKMKSFDDTKYLKVIRSLHENYVQKLQELDGYLGHALMETIPAILDQELSSLRRKIVSDMRVQELDQMKKALNFYLCM
ncbi:uncharacterized protein [Apostichopus japonicus]|uniref:uncharacterized protein isoform X2 n=1 Tax=Stichopus japonicus TaxID=307972 RepID=UPI003AB48F47